MKTITIKEIKEILEGLNYDLELYNLGGGCLSLCLMQGGDELFSSVALHADYVEREAKNEDGEWSFDTVVDFDVLSLLLQKIIEEEKEDSFNSGKWELQREFKKLLGVE